MIHLPLVLTDQTDPGRGRIWTLHRASLDNTNYYYETLDRGRIQDFPGEALKIVSYEDALVVARSNCTPCLLCSIGRNVSYLIDRADEPHVFRLQKDRVYYVKEELLKRAENVSRDNLVSLGVCFGKFTKTLKFKLHVTCLDYLAQYAKVG